MWCPWSIDNARIDLELVLLFSTGRKRDARQTRFMAHVPRCDIRDRDTTMTSTMTNTTTTTTTRREERRQKTRYARARCATVNTGPFTVSKPRCGVREPAQLQLVPAIGSAASRWNRATTASQGGADTVPRRTAHRHPFPRPRRNDKPRPDTKLDTAPPCLSLARASSLLVSSTNGDYFAAAPENRLRERTERLWRGHTVA